MGWGKRKLINLNTFCEFFATALVKLMLLASELQIVTETKLNSEQRKDYSKTLTYK